MALPSVHLMKLVGMVSVSVTVSLYGCVDLSVSIPLCGRRPLGLRYLSVLCAVCCVLGLRSARFLDD